MKKRIGLLLFFVSAIILCLPLAHAEEDTAFDQLNNMNNTGVTFDGSDGKRSGMDIDLQPTPVDIPEPPAPTPLEIPEKSETPPEIDPVEPLPLMADPVKPEPMTVDVDTTTYTGNGTNNTGTDAKDSSADDAQNNAGE